MRRRCSSSERSLSLKKSPSYIYTPSDQSDLQASPSPSLFSFRNGFGTTNDDAVSDICQSELAGSEDPWLVLASSTFCPEDDESRCRRCSDAVSPLVPHRNGYGVGQSSGRTSQVPVAEHTLKGRLCDPLWSQEPFELPPASRTCILLPQHCAVPVEYLNVNIATLLYAPCFRSASRSLTVPSVYKSFRVNPYG